MSRYTAKQLESAVDSYNESARETGLSARYRVGYRNGWTALDLYRPRPSLANISTGDENLACETSIEAGSPLDCLRALRAHYAGEVANHYRSKWEAIAPQPANDAPTIPQWVEGSTLTKLPARSPFDCKGPRSVTAYALLWQGAPAGKIVAHHGQSSCTAGVWVYRGPLQHLPSTWATVTGCGYDRFSAAVCKALGNAISKTPPIYPVDATGEQCETTRQQVSTLLDSANRLDGAGESRVCRWFAQFGYATTQVV